jgi:hypothetical protein
LPGMRVDAYRAGLQTTAPRSIGAGTVD